MIKTDITQRLNMINRHMLIQRYYKTSKISKTRDIGKQVRYDIKKRRSKSYQVCVETKIFKKFLLHNKDLRTNSNLNFS